MTTTDTRLEWFRHARLGIFVHFGLYSTAARHEWVMNYEEMSLEAYERYADNFDPDLFDARDIARRAREAGAGYVVLTTKHHDGFCLWDSALTDYTSVARTGRDLVAEFVAAVRAEGLRVGFYHSLLDWHHPDYTIDRYHPRRGDADWAEQNAAKDPAAYRAYLRGQLTELLTSYGPVDYLFFDFTEPESADDRPGRGPADWDAESLLSLCRELAPDMIVNDRLGIPADLVTPEQYQPVRPLTRDGVAVAWEACQTLNGSWGYHRDNLDFKPPEMLVSMLSSTVASGGNLLLNIGPDGRGAVPARDAATLATVAEWMRLHERSVVGCGPADRQPPSGVVYTQRDDRLYVHVLAWPFGHLHLPDLAGHVSFARFLHDGSEVRYTEIDPSQQANYLTPEGPQPGTLTLSLPVQRPDVLVPVIELRLGGAR